MADFNEKLSQLLNTQDLTADFDPQDIQSNRLMSVLAYFSWLVIIPLLLAGNSKYSRFHCNQGIVLALVELVAVVACGLLSKIPLLGWIFSLAQGLIGLVCFILSIVGIVNAANGRGKELPLVGSIRILK